MKVFVLRRALPASQEERIRNAFPGKEIEFRMIHSLDYLDHDRICEELNLQDGDFVVLPEKPIPSKAMERGVPHVAITPDGLMELVSIKPEFRPFNPAGC